MGWGGYLPWHLKMKKQAATRKNNQPPSKSNTTYSYALNGYAKKSNLTNQKYQQHHTKTETRQTHTKTRFPAIQKFHALLNGYIFRGCGCIYDKCCLVVKKNINSYRKWRPSKWVSIALKSMFCANSGLYNLIGRPKGYRRFGYSPPTGRLSPSAKRTKVA